MNHSNISKILIKQVYDSIASTSIKNILINYQIRKNSVFIRYNQARKMSTQDWKTKETIYEFSAKDIDGNEVSMEKYKGHPLLIVNVATNCGLAKANYKQLNEMYDEFEGQGLRIAAFPCNQFAGQEPGCDVDIKEFMKKNGVRFDMYSKIDVNGDSAHPIYKWLKYKQKGFLGFDAIKWNFTKFLVDKNGNAIKRYAPTVEPKDIAPDIQAVINDA